MVLMVGVMAVALPACERHEGLAERAGKAVDNAADNAGQNIEKAGEKIQDAAKGDKN